MSKFPGFSWPERNYFRLPNEWTDITHDISSLAELKLVEYVLRHTWGYQDPDTPRRISLDEFENGVKGKDGRRLDRGIGMSKPSIIDGARRAVAHGLLDMLTDGRDPARIRKLYRLHMRPPRAESGETLGTESRESPGTESRESPGSARSGCKETLQSMSRNFTVDVKKPYIDHKKTLRKETRKRAGLTARPPRGSPPSGKVQPAEWDRKAAGRVREMLVANDSDLTAPKGKQRAVGIDKLAEQVAKLQADRGVDRSEIKAVILWYAEHYADDYVPKLRKVADLFDCWGKIRDAKARWGTDRRRADNNGNGKVNGKKSRSRLVPEDADTCSDDDLAWMRKVAAVMVECMKQMQERGRDPWSWGGIGDDDVARALEKKKLPAGFCTADDCRRIGNCAPSRS